MNKNNRNKRDKMDDKAFIRAITRFRNGDQYLKGVKLIFFTYFSESILFSKKDMYSQKLTWSL